MIDIDKPVLLIGGGPSLNSVDFSKCPRDKFFILGTNKAYKLIALDVLFFMDKRFYYWNQNELMNLSCPKITTAASWRDGQQHNPNVVSDWLSRGIEYYSRENLNGLNLGREKRLRGNNSGLMAINLAVKHGAKEIYLLGFDMKPSKNGSHQFHNEHKVQSPAASYKEVMAPKFLTIVPDLKTAGVSVYNCNRDSALRCFEFKDIPWNG